MNTILCFCNWFVYGLVSPRDAMRKRGTSRRPVSVRQSHLRIVSKRLKISLDLFLGLTAP